MIHITLTQRDRPQPVDKMSQRALYEAARGNWVLGERALREHYAIVSFEGTVVLAMEIDALETTDKRLPEDTRDDRRAIKGKILVSGDEVYDAYVGKPTPIPTSRNPIKYFNSSVGHVPCRCDCGGKVELGDFLMGHDQRALHDRISKVGTVAEFLDWFDNVWKDRKGD